MPKRILILVSNPEGTMALNLPRELRQLKEAVQRSRQRDYFEVEMGFAATQKDLRRHILDVRPQIVHFCGHGTEQGLVLEDDNGKQQDASNEFLVSLLKNFADRIECVVLNACDTEPLADALAVDLNCVIGMSQPVRDEAAIVFAAAFYDGLGAGETYEKAFDLGRTAVLGLAASGGDESRKATVVNQDGRPIEPANQEHWIPVLKLNPNPKPIQPFWLAPEAERQAVRELLAAIDEGFNTIQLFHTREPIVLQDQYIPVQVTLERRYRHTVETIGAYAESEAELKRLYAMKGMGEEEIKRQQVDWQEARRQESRIVVLADPGMGKSTLLRREVGTTVQQGMEQIERGGALAEITVPVLIRLSTLAERVEQQQPILEAILAVMQERHADLLRHREPEFIGFLNEFLKAQLLNGKGLLLLDALDEVPDHQRPRLLEKLNEAGICKTCPIVATSRIVGYGGRLVDGAKDMEIVPFSQPQTEQYIEKWFANAQKSLTDQSVTARGLIQALRERPQIAGLAQNPLLLSLICSLYQHDKLTLPARRSQIYEQAVTCMLSEWGQTRLHPQGNPDRLKQAKTRLLEALAYHFTCEGQEVFDYEDLYDWVEAYLEADDAPRDLRDAKTSDLIAELSAADGILQKLYRDRDDDQYLFLHRTFQEYFTASYLKRAIKQHRKNPAYVTELVQTYCWNYDWHETLTLLAGLLEHPTPLIEAILAQKDDIFQTQLLLAGRCVAECRELSHPLVDEIVERIYRFWSAYPGAEFIQAVVVGLGQTQEKIFQALQADLEDENSYVRHSAASALGKIGNDKAVDALLLALSNQDWDGRGSAAQALGKIASERAIDSLSQALTEGDLFVSGRAATALGRIGGEKAISVLLKALSNWDPVVWGSAVIALAEVGIEKTINTLLEELEEDWYIRISTIMALGKLTVAGNDEAINALFQVLTHRDWVIKITAAAVLVVIRFGNAITSLLRMLFDQLNFIECKVKEALRKTKDDELIDVLIEALSHKSLHVRIDAILALGEKEDCKAIDAIIEAFSGKDMFIRGSAASILGKTNDVTILEKLLRLPNLKIDAVVLSLARSWAIRFSKSGSPLIPVYPEVIAAQNRGEKLDGTNE